VYDLIGGRASWTALGMPTAGARGDRGWIVHQLAPATHVIADSSIGFVSDWSRPVAVVGNDDVLLGSLEARDRALPAGTPVVQAMVPAPATVRPDTPVDDVMARLQKESRDFLFVTTVHGVLLGVATAGVSTS
jgi:hypothetical protein